MIRRALRGVVLAAVLVWAVRAELPRYRAERSIRLATEALRQLLLHPQDVPDPRGALSRIEDIALSGAAALPGDVRPWALAGSSHLVGGEPARAIDLYRTALGLGERAEIDMNLGKAYEATGDFPRSRAALLRAVWISPALLSALLPDVARELAPQLHDLEEKLRAGELKAPPPLPD